MTLKEIWQKLCEKDAELKNPQAKVEFRSENLKALLQQVYDQGRQSVPVREEHHYGSTDLERFFGFKK